MTLKEVKDEIEAKIKKLEEAKKAVADEERDLHCFIKANVGLDQHASILGVIECVEKVTALLNAEKAPQ